MEIIHSSTFHFMSGGYLKRTEREGSNEEKIVLISIELLVLKGSGYLLYFQKTSDPSVFEKDISQSTIYKSQILGISENNVDKLTRRFRRCLSFLYSSVPVKTGCPILNDWVHIRSERIRQINLTKVPL